MGDLPLAAIFVSVPLKKNTVQITGYVEDILLQITVII